MPRRRRREDSTGRSWAWWTKKKMRKVMMRLDVCSWSCQDDDDWPGSWGTTRRKRQSNNQTNYCPCPWSSRSATPLWIGKVVLIEWKSFNRRLNPRLFLLLLASFLPSQPRFGGLKVKTASSEKEEEGNSRDPSIVREERVAMAMAKQAQRSYQNRTDGLQN